MTANVAAVMTGIARATHGERRLGLKCGYRIGRLLALRFRAHRLRNDARQPDALTWPVTARAAGMALLATLSAGLRSAIPAIDYLLSWLGAALYRGDGAGACQPADALPYRAAASR